MPGFSIKLLHERKSGPVRKVQGRSGINYTFSWCDKIRAYLYRPVKQEETDDLFASQGVTSSTYFSPIHDQVESAKESAPAASTSNQVTGFMRDACDSAGIRLERSDNDIFAKRLLEAYTAGAKEAGVSLVKERSTRESYERAMVKAGIVDAFAIGKRTFSEDEIASGVIALATKRPRKNQNQETHS